MPYYFLILILTAIVLPNLFVALRYLLSVCSNVQLSFILALNKALFKSTFISVNVKVVYLNIERFPALRVPRRRD